MITTYSVVDSEMYELLVKEIFESYRSATVVLCTPELDAEGVNIQVGLARLQSRDLVFVCKMATPPWTTCIAVSDIVIGYSGA